jgi:hypothetical protein
MSQPPSSVLDHIYDLPCPDYQDHPIHEYDEPQKSPARSIPASPATPPTLQKATIVMPLQAPPPQKSPIRALIAGSSVDKRSRSERYAAVSPTI